MLYLSLHYEKLSVTRWTLISGAKISNFVDILGLFDQVERVLKYISPIFLGKGFWSHQEILEKASRQHVGSVRLGSYGAVP